MQDLIVGLVQADQIWENKEKNLENYSKMLENISNVDLLVFPEMFQTAFSMHAEELAESMDDSPSINWLKQLALEKNTAIYTSLIIKEKGLFYNRGIFMNPEGNIETYDKRKTFSLAGEDEVFTSGKKETIVNYKGWNIQLQICYDLRFPEIVRNRILPNQTPAYDLILYVANWPEKRSKHWVTLLQARAIENQSYVLGVNRIGEDGKNLNYNGNSTVYDAFGEELISKDANQEVKIVRLNKSDLEIKRKVLPFLKDL